jgi:hypothetical protein
MLQCNLTDLKISDFHGGDYEECHLLGCGSHKIYTVPHPRRRHSSTDLNFYRFSGVNFVPQTSFSCYSDQLVHQGWQ